LTSDVTEGNDAQNNFVLILCGNVPRLHSFDAIIKHNIEWMVGRLTPPVSTKLKLLLLLLQNLYSAQIRACSSREQGLGWRFGSARLKMAKDTLTSQPR